MASSTLRTFAFRLSPAVMHSAGRRPPVFCQSLIVHENHNRTKRHRDGVHAGPQVDLCDESALKSLRREIELRLGLICCLVEAKSLRLSPFPTRVQYPDIRPKK